MGIMGSVALLGVLACFGISLGCVVVFGWRQARESKPGRLTAAEQRELADRVERVAHAVNNIQTAMLHKKLGGVDLKEVERDLAGLRLKKCIICGKNGHAAEMIWPGGQPGYVHLTCMKDKRVDRRGRKR